MRAARETLAGFRQAGDVTLSALQEVAEAAGMKIEMGDRPGKGLTTLDAGMGRVREYAAMLGMSPEGIDHVELQAREQYDKAIRITESPIERSMLAALLTGRWAGCDTIPPKVHDGRKDALELLPLGDVVVVPQMAFIRFRLDFGLVVEKGGHRHILAIECDGAAYHTDARQDRFRDAYLKSWNVPTFRLNGSTIHEDAIAAADELIGAICAWKAS